MSLPPQLESDLQILKGQGLKVSYEREPSGNRIFIIIEKYPLPQGWNKKETRLLLISDISYPNSKLDMFWVDVDLKLDGGRVPQAGGTVETYNGQQWQRFSWHVQKWNPARDNVITYLDTIDARLRQLQ
jgi:hypothetical protein